MDKKNTNILVAVLVLVIVAGAGYWINNQNKGGAYSVVYMSTGEVYVGKLSTFPEFVLKDAYLYQVAKDAKDQTKTNFQLQPLKEALWAPESMHLVKENVIFYGELTSGSKIAQTLAGKK